MKRWMGLTNAKSLVVVAKDGPGDGEERGVLAAVDETVAALLKVDVVNPDVGAVVLFVS